MATMDRFGYTDTPNGFQVCTLETVDDLCLFIRKLEDHQRFVFRGQSDSRWQLETTLEREIPEGYKNTIGLEGCERAMLNQFQRRAHHYLHSSDIPEKESLAEWLALIQHHGGPTRFLDFTKSPFVAAHFALPPSKPTHSTAIWAVNVDYLGQNLEPRIREHMMEMSTVENSRIPHDDRTSPNYLNAAIQGRLPVSATVVIEPFRQNWRLMRQDGIFLAPLNVNKPFQNNLAAMFDPIPEFDPTITGENVRVGDLENIDDCAAVKMIIPTGRLGHFRTALEQMNIKTESLFPDLEGEARALHTVIARAVWPGDRL